MFLLVSKTTLFFFRSELNEAFPKDAKKHKHKTIYNNSVETKSLVGLKDLQDIT